MKPITIENKFTVIDINSNCLSPETLTWIQAQPPNYIDNVLLEHLYSVEDLQIDVQDEKDKTVNDEIEQIAALAEPDATPYVRIIFDK